MMATFKNESFEMFSEFSLFLSPNPNPNNLVLFSNFTKCTNWAKKSSAPRNLEILCIKRDKPHKERENLKSLCLYSEFKKFVIFLKIGFDLTVTYSLTVANKCKITAEDYPESRLSFKRISTRGRHHNYDDKCLIWDLIQFFVLKN